LRAFGPEFVLLLPSLGPLGPVDVSTWEEKPKVLGREDWLLGTLSLSDTDASWFLPACMGTLCLRPGCPNAA
jgi:hypothetical protein